MRLLYAVFRLKKKHSNIILICFFFVFFLLDGAHRYLRVLTISFPTRCSSGLSGGPVCTTPLSPSSAVAPWKTKALPHEQRPHLSRDRPARFHRDRHVAHLPALSDRADLPAAVRAGVRLGRIGCRAAPRPSARACDHRWA